MVRLPPSKERVTGEGGRPLSPHISIYRIQITSLLSITHRATGIFLFLSGFFWLALWAFPGILTLREGPLGGAFFVLVLAGFLLSLFYHLLNGIRHLIWDLGYGFEIRDVTRSGSVVLFLSAISTGGALWFLL